MRPILWRRTGLWPFLLLAIVIATPALLAERTPQPLSYHHFADQRSWLGISNFGDVASNIPFLAVGLWGLAFLVSQRTRP
jgi:hypothetical protein